jgi:hypothetical protein
LEFGIPISTSALRRTLTTADRNTQRKQEHPADRHTEQTRGGKSKIYYEYMHKHFFMDERGAIRET